MLDVSTWTGQFAFSRTPITADPSWTTREADGWHLTSHPSLPVIRTGDGWLLGWATDGADMVTEATVRNEDWGGRWLYVDTAAGRVFPDACASLACVFHAASQTVASTPLLASPDGAPADHADAYGIPDKDRFYAFGLTGHEGVRRLLPNHSLSLSSFEAERTGPRLPLPPISVGQAARVVTDEIRSTASALADRWTLLAGLTAGQDSRALLACLLPLKERVVFFTYLRDGNPSSRLDAQTARRLATATGVRHEVVPILAADASTLAAWLDRTGAVSAGQKRRNVTSDEACHPDRALLPGIVGEVARAYYWRADDTADMEVTTELVMERAKQPDHPAVCEAAEHWLRGLPAGCDAFLALDLLYLECRVGAWAMPSQYGPRRLAPTVALLSHAPVIDAMLRLSNDDKRAERLAPAVIRLAAPTLPDYPFNKSFGWRALRSRVAALIPSKARIALGALRRGHLPVVCQPRS